MACLVEKSIAGDLRIIWVVLELALFLTLSKNDRWSSLSLRMFCHHLSFLLYEIGLAHNINCYVIDESEQATSFSSDSMPDSPNESNHQIDMYQPQPHW